MIEGLYVTINPDGTIKKYLSTKDGEVPFPDRSIAEEVIALSDRDYIFLVIHRKNLLCMINGPDSDPEVIAEAIAVCEKIKQRNIICGTLAQFEFLDKYHYWTPQKDCGLDRLVDVTFYFGRAANAWADVCNTLKQLSQKVQVDMCYTGAPGKTVHLVLLRSFENEPGQRPCVRPSNCRNLPGAQPDRCRQFESRRSGKKCERVSRSTNIFPYWTERPANFDPLLRCQQRFRNRILCHRASAHRNQPRRPTIIPHPEFVFSYMITQLSEMKYLLK